ncbi:hypothetical protein PVAP13_4NG004401 [Panicum virgatum]|uniref:Uncharacterized protein n=1 Tax=Panicum virgatum TaxID=38727 RepID=A0A8T0T233_PANVG|nr:hypothetical protein PVAP13_4NG004401 [Panicum virgatum]
MGPFPDGLTAPLCSRPYLHTNEGRRAVSLPPCARVTRIASWAAHRLMRYITANARYVPLSPSRRPTTSDHGATHQDAFMERGSETGTGMTKTSSCGSGGGLPATPMLGTICTTTTRPVTSIGD